MTVRWTLTHTSTFWTLQFPTLMQLSLTQNRVLNFPVVTLFPSIWNKSGISKVLTGTYQILFLLFNSLLPLTLFTPLNTHIEESLLILHPWTSLYWCKKTRRGRVFLKKFLAQSPTLVSQITFGPLLYIVSEPFIYPHFREKYW